MSNPTPTSSLGTSDHEARDTVARLWDDFFHRLGGTSRQTPGPGADSLAALRALVAAWDGKGRRPDLLDAGGLWHVLAAVAVRTARAADPNNPPADLDLTPTPALAAAVADTHRRLLDGLTVDERRVAVASLEGSTAARTAVECGVALRTVERKLDLIRAAWAAAAGIPPPADTLTTAARRRIDTACDKFERAWKAWTDRFPRPKREQYLYASTDLTEYGALLEELAKVEAEYAPDWSYRTQLDEAVGPVSLIQLRALGVGGELPADARARRGNTGDWAAACAVLSGVYAVGDHDLRGVLGRGGMGVVFDAWHRKLARPVALKMLTRRGEAEARHEAEVVARLRHPNVVQIYEYGEHDGREYFSLEYADGGSLAARLAEFGLPPAPDGASPTRAQLRARAAAVAALVADLARAVHYAHGQGIIHRDLKPANVLLSKDEGGRMKDEPKAGAAGGSGSSFILPPSSFRPKITDFGIAKLLPTGEALAETQGIRGTPNYMAPEQASEDVRRIGPRTDVYGLGAILYELLTGRPPFKGKSLVEVLEKVRHEEPERPAQRNPRVPRDLDTICMKCLEKDPKKRYASAAELADDLDRFRQDRPVRARPVGVPERGYRWCRRNPKLAAASLVALVAVGTAAGFGVNALMLKGDVARQGGRADEAEAKRQEEEQRREEEKRLREKAEVKGEVSELGRLDEQRNRRKSELDKTETAADELLSRVSLRQGLPGPALDDIRAALALEANGRELLAKLGTPDDPEFDARWAARKVVARNEATHRLTRFHLHAQSPIVLPDLEPNQSFAAAADAAGKRVVVVYSGSDSAQVIDVEKRATRPLKIPGGSPPNQFGLSAGRSVALSPDGRKLVVDDADGTLALIDADTGRRLASLPGNIQSAGGFGGFGGGQAAANLRFTAGNRVELRGAHPDLDKVWTERGGKWALEPSKVTPKITPGLGQQVRPLEGKNVLIEQTAAGGISGIIVRPRGGGAGKTIWRPGQDASEDGIASDGFTSEILQGTALAPDRDLLYLATTQRLVVLDPVTGARIGTRLQPSPFSPARQVLAAPGVVFTLDPQSTAGSTPGAPFGGGAPARAKLSLTAWTAALPELTETQLTHAEAVRSLDITDGLVVTGTANGLARAWRGGTPLHDTTTPVRPLTRGGSTNPHDWLSLYPRWELIGPGGSRLLVERAETSDRGPNPADRESPVVTELFDADAGKRLHSFPGKGPGRLLRIDLLGLQMSGFGGNGRPLVAPAVSSCGRFAVAVAKDDGKELGLALWDFTTGKPVTELGSITHPKAIRPGAGGEVAIGMEWLNVSFSPTGRWLIIGRPTKPQVGAFGQDEWTLDLWDAPAGKRVGSLKLSGPIQRFHFDPDETRVVLFGGSRLGAGGIHLLRLDRWEVVADLSPAPPVAQPALPRGMVGRVVGPAEVGFGAGVVLLWSRSDDAVAMAGEARQPIGGVRVFRLDTGEPLKVAEEKWAQGPTAVISPDGTRLFLTGRRKPFVPGAEVNFRTQDFELWDLTAGKLLREGEISALIVAAGRNRGVPCDRDHLHVRRADLTVKPGEEFQALKWSDGSEARPRAGGPAVTDARGRILLWVGPDGAELHAPGAAAVVRLKNSLPPGAKGGLPFIPDASQAVLEFSPDEGRVFVDLAGRSGRGSGPESGGFPGGGFGAASPPGVWDARTGERLLTLALDETFAGFDSTGKRAMIVSRMTGAEGRLTIHDLTTGGRQTPELPATLAPTDPGNTVFSDVRLSRYKALLAGDGRMLVAPMQKLIQVWNLESKKPATIVGQSGHTGPVGVVAQHAGTSLIASGGDDGVVNLWDRADGKYLRTLNSHAGLVTGLAFSSDGSRLTSTSTDGTLVCWKVADGSRAWRYPATGAGPAVRCLAASPDRRRLVAGLEDGSVVLLAADDGRVLARSAKGSARVATVAFRPDGAVLAAGSADGRVRLFAAGDSLTPGATWNAPDPVQALCFAANGRYLFVGGKAARVCEPESGRVVWQFEPPEQPGGKPPDSVRVLGLNPATGDLVVADAVNRVRVLPLPAWSRALDKFGLGLPDVPVPPG